MSKLKLISITDTQLPTKLLESINELRNSGLFCDVTIIVQDRKFQAHRLMLAASSSYFRQLFSVAKQVIELNFIKADIFQEVLNYIYSSKITRIRSDKLEDLISAGQVLGVDFIANLATPLAQVKSLPGLSKEAENSNIDSAEKSESESKNMPIITESFSLSAEEFGMVNTGTVEKEDADNDVLFVSKTEVPKTQKTKSSDVIDVDTDEPEPKKQKVSTEEDVNPEVAKPQEEDSKVPSEGEVREELQTNPQPQQVTPPPVITPNIITNPSTNTNSNLPAPSVKLFTQSAPSTPTQANSASLNSCLLPEASEVLGVQKKKVMLEQSPDRPGKIKLSDVRPSFSTDNISGLDVTLTKKTITLDKASEIDSLSEGCKVYANIGENTYDIVPEKEFMTEGEVQTTSGKKPQPPVEGASNVSSTSPPGKKKGKEKDHYELVMDGKTFYVCAVCKRPYVCLTSLRRHFNTHSWERKYPCRYCDKVFALAEYRTKHELTHTGERRYQCLLCNEMFLNYQLLSTHCKQMHNRDPSGRKHKDESTDQLYRLLPFKGSQSKPYSFAPDDPEGIPMINEDGTVQHVSLDEPNFPEEELTSSESKMLRWDDIFVEPDAHTRPGAHARLGSMPHTTNQMNVENTTTEFEFVIPETY